MVTMIKSQKGSDLVIVACQACVRKKRRGRTAIFPASRSNDLKAYIDRHKKHE